MKKELEIDLPENLPTTKEELFCFSFNFENLVKTIDYLHKYNLALFSKIQNLNERMIKCEELAVEFPNLKKLTEDNQSKLNETENKLKETENKINEAQNKINETDNKIKELTEKTETNKSNIEKNTELITNNKKNIEFILLQNANDNDEYNFNDENLEEYIKSNKDNPNINIEEVKKKMTEHSSKGKNKDFESLNNKINVIGEKVKEIQLLMNLTDNGDKNLSNLINSINENEDISNQIDLKDFQDKGGDTKLFKLVMAQVEKNRKHFQEMLDKYNNDLNEYKKDFKAFHQIYGDSTEKVEHVQIKGMDDVTKNIDLLFSKVNQMPKKSDLENIKSELNSKIQRINERLKDGKNLNIKEEENEESHHHHHHHHKNSDGKEEALDDYDQNEMNVNRNINDLISDLLKSEGKNIDISKNKHFIELLKLNKQNSKELTKNARNYFDLKALISSSQNQQDLDLLKTELSDIKIDYDVFKKKLQNVIKILGDFDYKKFEEDKEKNGEEKKSIDNQLSEETVKGKIDFITDYIGKLNNNLTKVDKRLGSITKDIKDDIKSSLKVDTYKVVEQFKLKLNSFTEKFESELKTKIDKMGLNAFESNLNKKFSLNLKDKLSKNDLKKNNIIIGKKIDTLENKISKTLVDTIIDIQMDDVPLIIKKNHRNVDLCASCNRPINEHMSQTIEQIPLSTSPNFMVTPRTRALRNICSLKKLPIISTSPK